MVSVFWGYDSIIRGVFLSLPSAEAFFAPGLSGGFRYTKKPLTRSFRSCQRLRRSQGFDTFFSDDHFGLFTGIVHSVHPYQGLCRFELFGATILSGFQASGYTRYQRSGSMRKVSSPFRARRQLTSSSVSCSSACALKWADCFLGSVQRMGERSDQNPH